MNKNCKAHIYKLICAGMLAFALMLGICVEPVMAANLQPKVNAPKANVNVTRSTTDENGAVVGINISAASDTAVASKSGSVGGIDYDKLAMANVDEAVNVRASASENSELIGKLYSECGGEILEQSNGWTKIKTGDLTGWVKNTYLLFGDKAQEYADTVVTKTATSTTETLRVRKEPGEDATVLTLLAKGDEIPVAEELGEWVKVEFADGTEGYVSAQYVSISNQLGKGETIEAINAREEAEKEEQKKLEAEAKKNSSQSAEAAVTEAAVAAAAAVPTVTATAGPTATNNGAVYAEPSDVMLLAALIQCEAGSEIYEGQVAVGSVVMNRLRSGRYGNSIYSVIYAKSQFSPAGSGLVAKVLAQGPKASCIQAAQEALSGVSYVGNCTKFRNIRSGYQGIVIGNHVFW